MKKNPFFTLMIIPHTEDRPKSLRLTIFPVRFLSILSIVALTFSFLWLYNYNFLQIQNNYLLKAEDDNKKVISEFSKDYLSLYQDVKSIKGKMVAVQMLEEQVKQKNVFDPTKSYFATTNQKALTEKEDKSNVVASTISSAQTETENQEILVDSDATKQEISLNDLVKLMEDRNQVLPSVPSIYPTSGRIANSFSFNWDPINNALTLEKGVNIINSYGTPIYATADGIVIFSGTNSSYGYEVIINHGSGFETYYGHNSRNIVEAGDFVKKGQIIAYMGNSNEEIGPYLDYRISNNGRYINPISYFN